MIENPGGVVLELGHDEILNVLSVGSGSLKITWKESGRQFDLIVASERSYEIVAQCMAANADCHFELGAAGQTAELSEEIAKDHAKAPRFSKIPDYVLPENIWNDCWFDQKFNLYVTHNSFFRQIKKLQDRHHQIEYRTRSNDDEGIVAKPDKVALKYGIPAVRLDVGGKATWVFLPTISKQFLKEQMKVIQTADDAESESDKEI